MGRSESEVIALGVETGIRVIIDDAKARKVAESLGLKVVGTIGILILHLLFVSRSPLTSA